MIQEKMKTSESDSRITKVVMLVCNQIFRRILKRSFESDLYRVSQKNYTLFWRAVAPLNFELGIKVGGVLEFSGSQL